MAKKVTIPFIGGQNRSRSVQVNNQETVNLTAAIKGAGAKAPVVLEHTPGLVEKATAGDGPLRTPKMIAWTAPGAIRKPLYAVFGTKFIEFRSSNQVVELGTLNTTTGTCIMARGRNFITIVDGTNGYTWDGTTFAEITDLDFPANFVPAGIVTHVTYMDGFFIVNDANTDDFYISGVEDPTAWNALDFEAASVAPDNSLAITTNASILWIFGDKTAQPYYNSGNADFPYELYVSGVQETGIAAPYSLAESDDGIFYLATTPEGGLFVFQLKGTNGQVISGDEQDQFLSALTAPEDTTGFIYKQEGKSYYVLQLDNGVSTLIYNIKTKSWETRDILGGRAWRAAGHGIQKFRNIVGSRLAARLYELDLSVHTDAGAAVVRKRVTEILHNNGMLLEWWELVVDVQSGVGNVNEPFVDPQLSLRYSDDGGESWSNTMLEPMGRIGQRMMRATYRNLGESRARNWEITYSADTQFTLVGAYAVVEVLDD